MSINWVPRSATALTRVFRTGFEDMFKTRVVSIGGFLSIPVSFLYKGSYYSKLSSFPFYSDDVIVSQKCSNEMESKLSMGGAYLFSRPSLYRV